MQKQANALAALKGFAVLELFSTFIIHKLLAVTGYLQAPHTLCILLGACRCVMMAYQFKLPPQSGIEIEVQLANYTLFVIVN